jgi:hypothetical protein
MDGAMCAVGFALLASFMLITWSLSGPVVLTLVATWLTSALVLAMLISVGVRRLSELRGESND